MKCKPNNAQSALCPFCDKASIERQGFFETDTEIVLHNIRPLAEGQCLVIPRRHVSCIRQLTDDEIGNLFRTVKLVSEKLHEFLKPAGFNYGINEGERAGQTVEHLHVHILPRFKSDKVMEHHVFHKESKPDNMTEEKMKNLIEELRSLFK